MNLHGFLLATGFISLWLAIAATIFSWVVYCANQRWPFVVAFAPFILTIWIILAVGLSSCI
jgi:hypothetical protein